MSLRKILKKTRTNWDLCCKMGSSAPYYKKPTVDPLVRWAGAQETVNNPSKFLGHLESAKAGIVSNDDEGSFSFWVAGTTKIQGSQEHLKSIQENYFNVVGADIEVTLKADLSNKFDPHAVMVIIHCTKGADREVSWVGYVPQKISTLLWSNLRYIHSGKVVRIKTYTTNSGKRQRLIRVSFSYMPEIKADIEVVLESIMDEID